MTAVLNHKRWLVCLAFLLCFLPLCRAQQTQEQLAAHYYSTGQFEQAAESYEALYARAPNKFYYQMLFRSYLELKEYKDALRLVEKRIKQYPNDLYLYVDMGRTYELRGDRRKANKTFESAVQKIGFDTKQISELTQAFETAGHPEQAIQVYLLARQKMRNDLAYVSELATLYQHVGNYEAMMQEYFDLLDKSPNMLGSIQISLQRVLNETANPKLVEGLRSTLVQRVQQSPDNKSYIEMMLWFSLQQKDFQFALVEAKAVDARFPDMAGEPLMRVASIARSNQDYDVAQECYRLVAQKGSDCPNYFPARVGALEVAFARLNRNFPIENKLLNQLLHDYQSALDELGKNLRTVQLMRNYSDLLAYYADSVQPAADLLYDVLDLPKLPAKERDETKLALADLLLFAGEVWDASLLYMQVEKANKNDVLGSLAKFKNAKLSYYNNDFLWAKTQLNEERLSNPMRARSCYEKLILDYPSSLYVDQARKRYRALSDALPPASVQ